MQNTHVSIAEIKNHLSEYIANSVYKGIRYVITKRNRPVAALIRFNDLQLIENKKELEGLASISGKWKHFKEVEDSIGSISGLRKKGGPARNVSL